VLQEGKLPTPGVKAVRRLRKAVQLMGISEVENGFVV
jgi:hypothetical protein